MIDSAANNVVHGTGSFIALGFAYILGSRLRKYFTRL
jgi:ammonia channel protein AmtB